MSGAALEQLVSISDLWSRFVVPFLTVHDVGRLECTCRWMEIDWKILMDRDFLAGRNKAPVFHETLSFDRLVDCGQNYKEAYEKWHYWKCYTRGMAKAEHLVQAIEVWDRLKSFLRRNELQSTIDTLLPCPSRVEFCSLSEKFASPQRRLSSVVAFVSVHGGQTASNSFDKISWFTGILGSFRCYNQVENMRLMGIASLANDGVCVAMSSLPSTLGISSTLWYRVKPSVAEGELILDTPDGKKHVAFRGDFLQYICTYCDKLESAVYIVEPTVPQVEWSRSISLYPNSGPSASCVVTSGIEVRASARWLPSRNVVNFAYCVRIRLVSATTETYQLIGRHWTFTDGNGEVNQVDGGGVIGKQPIFFWEDGASGYIDSGPAGDLSRNSNKVFCYQSQSGHVNGVTAMDSNNACVEGTFSFAPGTIENRTGPIFHVTVGRFPLRVEYPFY